MRSLSNYINDFNQEITGPALGKSSYYFPRSLDDSQCDRLKFNIPSLCSTETTTYKVSKHKVYRHLNMHRLARSMPSRLSGCMR